MFKKTAIAAAVGLTLSVGAQADYRWQLDGQAGRTNIDVGRDDGDVDQFGIGGRFYFDDVDTGNGPLGEAAFLDHASYVGAGYVYTDLDDIVEEALTRAALWDDVKESVARGQFAVLTAFV